MLKGYSILRQAKYIDNMCTKGGITEEIVNSLNSGSTVLDALRKGIAKSEEISTFTRLALSISKEKTG